MGNQKLALALGWGEWELKLNGRIHSAVLCFPFELRPTKTFSISICGFPLVMSTGTGFGFQ